MQVKAGVEQAEMGTMMASATQGPEVDRVSLATSAWNEWRPIHLSRGDLLGYAMWPALVVALILRPDLYVAFGLITTALWLIVLRNQRKPYFTSTHLHSGRGWFGLTHLAIPLARIDDVVVEPVQVLPGMGTINVRYGLEYLSFECVADAERKADLLREAVAIAVAKGRSQ